MSHRALLALVVVPLLMLAGCRFDGIDSLALPGGKGTGEGAWTVTVEIPDVGTLTPNAQVKVDDIAVGTVTEVRVANWHAEAVLSLDADVELPANALARVGINTLLGAAFLELSAPQRPRGVLTDGARISLDRGRAYPSTEQVLAAASLALNGGGLEQLATVTTELNAALGGNDRAIENLLPRLDSFIGTLDGQREEILTVVRDVARLSKRFAKNRGVLTGALDEVGPALEVLARNRPELTTALTALTELSKVATPLVARVKEDLLADLNDLVPVLQAVTSAGDSTVKALGFAVTFPFDPQVVTNVCRGDYCNLGLTVDLTNESLISAIIRPDGSIGVPGLPGLPNLGDLLGQTLDGVTGLLNGLGGGATVTKGAGRKGGGQSSTPDGDQAGVPTGTSSNQTLAQLLGQVLGGGR